MKKSNALRMVGPSPVVPRPHVNSAHVLVAGLLLALLSAFTYLRRPALLCLAGVAAILGQFGSDVSGVGGYGAAGVLAVLLLTGSEWLLHRSAGSRLVWPAALALAVGAVGACLAALQVWGQIDAPGLLAAAMFLTLPWVPAASAVRLALSGLPNGRESVAMVAVTRTLLDALRTRVADRTNFATSVAGANEEAKSALLVRIDRVDALLTRMTAGEHSALRPVVLHAQALMEAARVDDALDALAGFSSNDCGHGKEREALEAEAEHHGWFVRNAVALIHAYRQIVPEQHRRGCRFEPTCSSYLEDALLRHGVMRGLRLGFSRALRCVPYGDAGLDPVPARAVLPRRLVDSCTGSDVSVLDSNHQQQHKESQP